MSSWRDAILNDFVPNVSKLTLVADPDCLLTEEKLALELRGRGFDLIEFNDPVEFRYAYESKYRSIWDRGEHTDLVVILRLQDAELESLPYDLLQAGRKLSFNLGDLFPTQCVGWHLTKTGDRFAALQPISMAVNQRFGSVGKDAARGLTLRMDNGSQYLSEHFQNQIKFWGIAPSFAFVSQPQTNGVAERFNKTLKEQIIYGRTYRNIEELRIAVTAFMERYNQHWLVEKLGFRSPKQAMNDFYNDQLKATA